MINFLVEDICKLKADCIVNPTDCYLSGGGGVDDLIHQRAGVELKKACLEIGSCRLGEAVLTEGFQFGVKYIIHTAVPKWSRNSPDAEYLLAACYVNSLELAKSKNAFDVVFAAMGTGSNGFPEETAAGIAVSAVWKWLERIEGKKLNITFTFASEDMRKLYQKKMCQQIIKSFKEMCSPANLAVFLGSSMPLFFKQSGGYVELPEDEQALADIYEKQYYEIGDIYYQYAYILYEIIGRPDYKTVVGSALKECGGRKMNAEVFMEQLQQMFLDECICFLIYLQREAYWSGGVDAPHLKNCMNGNVYKILDYMERMC